MSNRASQLQTGMFMTTNQHIDMAQSMLRQQNMAAAAGRMETINQLQMVGGGGFQPGAFQAMAGRTWLQITMLMVRVSPLFMVGGCIGFAVSFVNQEPRTTILLLAWLVLFFVVLDLAYITPFMQPGWATGVNFIYVIVVSGALAAAVAFIVYDPNKDDDPAVVVVNDDAEGGDAVIDGAGGSSSSGGARGVMEDRLPEFFGEALVAAATA